MKYVPTHTSVAAWAKSLGSSAKTHAGQRKAIIASFKPLRGRDGQYLDNYRVTPQGWFIPATKAAYLAKRERTRQEAFAASHPLTLSMPVPATRQDIEGRCTGPFPVLTLQANHDFRHFAVLAGWTVRLTEDVSYDNSRYSKAWHNAHGGAKSVDARTVCIRRVRPDGTLENRDVPVSAWRGNYILDALIAAGVCEKHSGQMAIRLHPAYAIELVRKGNKVAVFERTLAGDRVDFVAVHTQFTFHADTKIKSVQGMREKMRNAHLRVSGQLITKQLGRKLGFCEAGIEAFCQAFNLDPRGSIYPKALHALVTSNPNAAAPFASELRTLAAAVNYNAS